MVSNVSVSEVLDRLGSPRREWVERFRDAIRETFGDRVRDLRLFGSTVHGEMHDESDVDVLVLLDDATWDDVGTAVDLAMSISPWIEPHVIDYERYHAPVSRGSGFYKELRTGSVRL